LVSFLTKYDKLWFVPFWTKEKNGCNFTLVKKNTSLAKQVLFGLWFGGWKTE
jgi:hypothetical protein